jgi:hypothetical protein
MSTTHLNIENYALEWYRYQQDLYLVDLQEKSADTSLNMPK